MGVREEQGAVAVPIVSDDALRRQIRARLSEGRLPAIDGVSKSHRGTGRPCIVCRRAIESTEVERELDGVGVVLIAHEACYKLWHEESKARRSTAITLGALPKPMIHRWLAAAGVRLLVAAREPLRAVHVPPRIELGLVLWAVAHRQECLETRPLVSIAEMHVDRVAVRCPQRHIAETAAGRLT